ncbi:coagulation factor V-like [Engraulis encrasicolus]|uniref:coagulation factor V-like n=1 Tax=Engraulis encrasicolus TaxID=184585 RepID=UPI002FD5BDE7
MRPSPHEGTLSAWLLLAFLSSTTLAAERHYYIAAVNIDWDYSHNKTDRVFKKAVYREYEDASFTKPKLHPPSLGLLGPTLRGEEGDVIIVKFRNMVDHPCNIHTHGVSYGKQSEGALYFDNTSQKEKEDDVINPEGSHVYTWELTSGVAPTAADPPCLTHTYFSHVDMTSDYNSGLIGTLLVCKPGSLDASGNQKHFDQEQVLLFGIFDESLSWYSKGAPPSPELMKYTINGYTHGSIPGLSVCAYSSVTWHFLGMSSTPELFSVHFHGQVFAQNGHRVSSLGMVSGTTTSGVMTPLHEGRWLVASYLNQHMEAGMHGFLTVETCEAFKKPVRKLSMNEMLNSRLRTYYIAAEEVIWDYTPNLPDYVDADFKSKYLKQDPDRIGHRYKKAVFTLYTDETFTKLNESKMEQGIIGPVIRAQLGDDIKIVFKNKASRPYSIYPHGLTLDKAGEGASYPAGGNQSHAVQPGQTYTYEWNVVEEDEPLAGDARCLTRMYHSAVDTPRDIASGLIGPLLICKGLDPRKVQMKADKEQHAMFAIFDENKSWYLDENIQDRCTNPARVRKDAPDFYASNVMHTINGYMFESSQVLRFCYEDIASWHVSSIGEQSRIQTVTFYGHTFEVNNREEDFLSLFPMTGETVSMHMDNKGDWLLSTLYSHDSTKGMRVKFKVVECIQDDEYKSEYAENEDLWNVVKPPEYVPPPPKKEEPVAEKVIDLQTDYYADFLKIRSHKSTDNKTTSDMQLLDHSVFDYDFDSGEDQTLQNPGKSYEPLNVSNSEMSEMSAIEPLQKSPDSDVNNTMGNGTNSSQTSVVNGTIDNSENHHDIMSNEKSDDKTTNNTELVDYGKSLMAQDTEKSGELLNVSHFDDRELLDREYGYADSIPIGNQTIQNPGESRDVSDSDGNNTMNSGVHSTATSMLNVTGFTATAPPLVTPPIKVSCSIRGDLASLHRLIHKCRNEEELKEKGDDKQGSSPLNITVDAQNENYTRLVENTTNETSSEVGNSTTPSPSNQVITSLPVNVSSVASGPQVSLRNSSSSETSELGSFNERSQEEYDFIEDPYAQSIHEQGNNLPAADVRKYYLSIEEVDWDYGGYGQKRSDIRSDGRPTAFKKVVYKGYLDPLFRVPDIRGEVEEHLGILGPVIRAEVGDIIMVLVRNLASRPYSLHANGVSYSKDMEGLNYVDGTPNQKDNAIGVNQTYTYMWKVNDKVGPKEVGKNVDPKERGPDCRTWAYYSGVNPERDINSGLIGPLLVCRKGTLSKKPIDIREFVLLFMTFDENKSWYYEKNYALFERKNKRTVQEPLFNENIKFPAINGIVYALRGLRMYTNQLTNWHLINMGAANDVQSIHFHGQTFLNHQRQRQSVYPLLPGGLTTLQMTPSKPGLWLLESEVGEDQQGGMQTLFLVIDNDCGHPLGLISGSVEDKQITADHTRGYWQPHLARLHNSGKYNAWSTDQRNSWIQVDFQRPVVISKVATQGAKEMFYSNYVTNYTISYSNDRRKWVFYKGDSDTTRKTFAGNSEANKVKENIFFPPLVGRFIRLHPLHSYNQPTVRMEYYGCELDGCSVPIGMKSRDIGDQKITASSTASNWYAGTWEPWLARLDKQGTVNAWQAKYNDLSQWLQVELRTVKKITGIITQGAKSLGTRMYVTAYTLQYSKDGLRWTKYTDNPDYEIKEFEGNTDSKEHKRNYIYPPIFAKFIRIVPKRWKKAISMRLELLGCDFE